MGEISIDANASKRFDWTIGWILETKCLVPEVFQADKEISDKSWWHRPVAGLTFVIYKVLFC